MTSGSTKTGYTLAGTTSLPFADAIARVRETVSEPMLGRMRLQWWREVLDAIGDGGPIKLQPTDSQISISRDGTISVREGNNAKTESQRGKLRMVGFAQPGQLQKDGSSTFMAPKNVAPQADTTSRFVQGTLEKSNVRGVVEMSRMIEITRSYMQIAKMLTLQSDLGQTAINKLAEVPN